MTEHASPYANQPAHAFWRSSVVERKPETVRFLHQPRFALTPQTAILTAGSCFAQHLHRTLIQMGWGVILKEDVAPMIPPKVARRYGYGQYSARYGNIYTARQFLELIREAMGASQPLIWHTDGRFYDALRPGVEPGGLETAEEVVDARTAHLTALRAALLEADCVIFTLGLTEAWRDAATGRVLPTAPGTVAGSMTDTPATFVNFSYEEVLADMEAVRVLLRELNPEMRLLLTVSPVPLTATATGAHVVQASTTSKAILRAVCDAMLRRYEDVDYFPSYEIITTPVLGGPFFDPNLRSPSQDGVSRVMDVFVQSYAGGAVAEAPAVSADPVQDWDVACEDILLEAFAK